jgi:PhnB protein
MAEPNQIEQLNIAVEAMLSGAETLAALDRPTRELLGIARRLRMLPREDFRQRLMTELKEKTMTATATQPTVKPIREGFHTLTPYVIVNGASQFLDFMKQVFGAEERFRVPKPDGTIMHAEVNIGDSIIEVADAGEQYPPRLTAIHLYVADVDGAYQRALAAGSTSISAPADQPYGDRDAGVKDPFGNRWYIGMHVTKANIVEGVRAVTPTLHPVGADKFIDFLKRAFGAEEVAVYREWPEGPVVHAKIRIGDSMLALSEPHGPYQPIVTGLHLYTEDTDAMFKRAVAAGASPIFEPRDEPYGDRCAGVTDPAGNSWFIATHIRDMKF